MASAWGAAVRAVHLKVHPRPFALGESREVLRVLQQFGEVTMFRHLKYDHSPAPHTYLAIFRHEDSASKLLKASPLRVTLDPILPDPDAAENHPLRHAGKFKARAPGPGEAVDSPTSDEQDTAEDSRLRNDLEGPEFRLDTGQRKSGHEEMTRASKILFEALASIEEQPEAQGDLSFDAFLGATKETKNRNQDLGAEEDGSTQDDGPGNNPPQPLPPREFDITIDVSDRNHRDSISSQVFWNTFTPKVKSLPFLDLTSQGVSPNIADVSMHRQPPYRIFEKIRRHAEMKPTLMQLWDAGPDGKNLLSEWSSVKEPKKFNQKPSMKFEN